MYFIIGFQPLYWLVSFLFFFAIILLTIFDLKRVKEIAMSGVATKNMAMLCALNLYVDFIYIFLRVLRIVAIIAGNRR
jgi:FtsH-binding integral membrane protein